MNKSDVISLADEQISFYICLATFQAKNTHKKAR